MRYWIDVERGLEKTHGKNLNTADLFLTMRHYYLTDERIIVARVDREAPEGKRTAEYVRRGRVGMTTGYKPAFLLMHRTTDIGSSDVLDAWDVPVGLVDPKGKDPSVIVACGSGHFGTVKSDCTKYLGHPGAHTNEEKK